MKLTLKTTLIVATIAFSSHYAMASGIPTVDAAGIATTIAENLKTIEQLKSQLDAINQQIDQAKQFANDTKNRFEGNWKLSDLVNNDDFLNSLPSDAKDILVNGMSLDGLRNKYGLKSDNAGLQEQFDNLMAYRERLEKNYKNTLKRIDKLNQIKTLNDAATNPTQKQDVANKLALMQLEFNQEQAALRQAEEQFKAQEKVEREVSNQEWERKLEKGKQEFYSKFSK
ncbi:TPA: type IV secretion system protein [Providencia alcalifaciens]